MVIVFMFTFLLLIFFLRFAVFGENYLVQKGIKGFNQKVTSAGKQLP